MAELPGPNIAPMVLRAREELLDLCTPEAALLWNVCLPNLREDSGLPRDAPSSGKYFCIKPVSSFSEPMQQHIIAIVGAIGGGLADIFRVVPGQTCSLLYNTTFWDQFYMSLVFELGSSLLKTYGQGCETDVRRDLLLPLLDRAANCVSLMMVKGLHDTAGEGTTSEGAAGGGDNFTYAYHSAFTLETATEGRPRQKGRKPSCDFAFSGWMDGEPLYFIPIEAKLLLSLENLSQLAHYMSTTVEGEYRMPNASIGILIDQNAVGLGFSVMSLEVESKTIPIPIVLMTPQLKWKKGTAIQKPVCIALCLLCLLQVKRLVQPSNIWKGELGDSMWARVVDVAMAVERESFVVRSKKTHESYDIFEEMQALRDKVEELTQKVNILEQCSIDESEDDVTPRRKIGRLDARPFPYLPDIY
jgi:hypothetical protein